MRLGPSFQGDAMPRREPPPVIRPEDDEDDFDEEPARKPAGGHAPQVGRLSR